MGEETLFSVLVLGWGLGVGSEELLLGFWGVLLGLVFVGLFDVLSEVVVCELGADSFWLTGNRKLRLHAVSENIKAMHKNTAKSFLTI
ncbi:MAG: hypothetical protein J6B80_01080 [Clostridia bacterium]|nr:hypothetical protein [Clostridia bacterium]